MIHELTHFGGKATVLGRLRNISFHSGEGDTGTLHINGLSLQDARDILAVLSTGQLDGAPLSYGGVIASVVNSPGPATNATPAPGNTTPTPAGTPKTEKAPEKEPEPKGRPSARRAAAETKSEDSKPAATKSEDSKPAETAPEAKPKVEKEPETKPEETKAASSKPGPALNLAAAADVVRKSTGAPKAIPDTAPVTKPSEDDNEFDAAPATADYKPVLDLDKLPAEIKTAKNIRTIMAYLWKEKGMRKLDHFQQELARLQPVMAGMDKMKDLKERVTMTHEMFEDKAPA